MNLASVLPVFGAKILLVLGPSHVLPLGFVHYYYLGYRFVVERSLRGGPGFACLAGVVYVAH